MRKDPCSNYVVSLICSATCVGMQAKTIFSMWISDSLQSTPIGTEILLLRYLLSVVPKKLECKNDKSAFPVANYVIVTAAE